MSPSVPQADQGQALQSATSLGDGETQIFLFASADDGTFAIRRVNPSTEVAKKFRSIGATWATMLTKRTRVPYSAGRRTADYEVAVLPIEGIDALTGVLASMAQPVDSELYSDPAFALNLRFYVVAAKRPNPGWVYFFKAKGETLRLKRTKKLALVPSAGVFDELEADPLLFDTTFDAVICGGYAFIENQTSFERSLTFVEQASAAAVATLNRLLPNLAVTNASDFLEAVGSDINMMSKLRSISAKLANPAYAAAMTTEKLIAFAEARGIPIDTEEVNDVRQFIFMTDPQRRWRILKLLDDDYLHSTLTELDYEVNSKSPMS